MSTGDRAFHPSDYARLAAVLQFARVGRDGDLKSDASQARVDKAAEVLAGVLEADAAGDFDAYRFWFASLAPVQQATMELVSEAGGYLKAVAEAEGE